MADPPALMGAVVVGTGAGVVMPCLNPSSCVQRSPPLSPACGQFRVLVLVLATELRKHSDT